MECDCQSGIRTPATHCLDGSVTAVLSAAQESCPSRRREKAQVTLKTHVAAARLASDAAIRIKDSGKSHCDLTSPVPLLGAAERRTEKFTDAEAEQVDRAAKRLAAAFGYGTSWQSAPLQIPEADGLRMKSATLPVAHRGQVTEQAARTIGGCRHVRRQHAWAIHGGIHNCRPDKYCRQIREVGMRRRSICGTSDPYGRGEVERSCCGEIRSFHPLSGREGCASC